MTDAEKKAAEIDALIKKDADDKAAAAKKDAEGEAGPSLADVMTAIKGCADSMGAMSARLDALEAAGKGKDGEEDDDGDVDGEAKRAAYVDARKRADAVTAEQRQELANIQMRADAVCMAFSERAPMPLHGELPEVYRVRLLEPFKKQKAQCLQGYRLEQACGGRRARHCREADFCRCGGLQQFAGKGRAGPAADDREETRWRPHHADVPGAPECVDGRICRPGSPVRGRGSARRGRFAE
jgi:hypothetical protein